MKGELSGVGPVFAGVADPIGSGFVASLARRGGRRCWPSGGRRCWPRSFRFWRPDRRAVDNACSHGDDADTARRSWRDASSVGVRRADMPAAAQRPTDQRTVSTGAPAPRITSTADIETANVQALSQLGFGGGSMRPGGQRQITVDRSALDRSIAGQWNGNLGRAQVDVNLNNMPRGAKADASGDGVFDKVRIKKTPAMNTTGSYGTDDSNYSAQE